MGYAGRRPIRALAVAAAMLALIAPVATAHTEVTSTSPKAGAYAKRSLSKVLVRFNQPIRSGRLQVLRAGEQVSTGSGRRSPGNVRAIEARLDGELAGGTYVARWTMTAVDGHTQKGSWRFKVRPKPASARTDEATPTPTPTPTATPTPSAGPQATEAASAPADDRGGPWLLVGGIALLGVLAAGGLVAVRRRSGDT